MVFCFWLVVGGKGVGGIVGTSRHKSAQVVIGRRFDGRVDVPCFVDVVCQEGGEKEKESPENDAEGKINVVVGHGWWGEG
jgi:hypothetical protein